MAFIGGASVKKRTMSCCQFARQVVGGQQTTRQTNRRPRERLEAAIRLVGLAEADNLSDNPTTCRV
jgi:hypothetical protein